MAFNKLQSLILDMQDCARRYIELTPSYTDRDGNISTTDDLSRTEFDERNLLFANDIVYLLDGPEQREAQTDCYARALPDEPTFTLLARDPDFARLIRLWAAKRRLDIDCGVRPLSDGDLVAEAEACASNGAQWRKDNPGKWYGQKQPQSV